MSLSVGGALAISAASSLLGGGMSALGSAQANKRGVKLAREQMKWQEEQTEKSRKWNEDIYNRYESASAQAAQYRAAGLNPLLQGIQTGQVGNVETPSGVAMPDIQNELSGIGNGVSSALNSASNILSSSSQKDVNDTLQSLQDAQKGLVDAQKNLSEQQTNESIQRVEQLKQDVAFLQATFDSRVQSTFYDGLRSSWQNMDAEFDARSKMFTALNILPEQQKVLQNQSIYYAATAFKAVMDGRLTYQDITHYLKNLSIRQTQAVAASKSADAALLSARNQGSYLKHLSDLVDSQKGEVDRRNASFDLPLMHNGKLTKAGYALQYTLYNQNKAVLTNTLMQPDMMNGMRSLWQSMEFVNYSKTGQNVFDGVGGFLDSVNMINSDSETHTTKENWKYDEKGNRFTTGGTETHSYGNKNTSSRSRKKFRKRR